MRVHQIGLLGILAAALAAAWAVDSLGQVYLDGEVVEIEVEQIYLKSAPAPVFECEDGEPPQFSVQDHDQDGVFSGPESYCSGLRYDPCNMRVSIIRAYHWTGGCYTDAELEELKLQQANEADCSTGGPYFSPSPCR